MRFKQYLTEEITDAEIRDFIKRWKMKLSTYGVTEFDLSIHGFKRLNHERNKPPISVDDLDFVLEGFLKKVGNQFREDVVNVKNNTAKKRGFNKKQIPPNNLEFTVKSKSTKVNFVFVLKQDRHTKNTAIVLPMTIMRKKVFKTTKGEEVIVERRML
jgi:hypothetical protein